MKEVALIIRRQPSTVADTNRRSAYDPVYHSIRIIKNNASRTLATAFDGYAQISIKHMTAHNTQAMAG